MNGYIVSNIEPINTTLRALSNEHRLCIMKWIMNPEANFPPQKDGDLVQDGVCVGFITEKIGLSQPTVTSHMKILTKAGLVSSKKIKNWVFYKPQRERFKSTIKVLQEMLG
ncbi:MAG: helix-turn-helix domain-containing protein [Amylibacter sp.]